jgi:L-fuconolactonase
MIIDAHQHFWQLKRGDYDWLTPALIPLYRDFLPTDLQPILTQESIDGTVLIQAAPTVSETEFLLNIADENAFVWGVVGWVDFANTTAPAEIRRLAEHSKLVGLRPMIQDISDDDWMLGKELAPAFEAMLEHNLTFDALVLPRHLPQLRQLLLRYPDLQVVINHAAKPDIASGHIDVWAHDIAAIANDSSAYCKFSGLLTEAGDSCKTTDLKPYIAHLFTHFGAERLIWGSDWPVLTLAASYADWLSMAQALTLVRSTKAKIFGQNACHFYKLQPI